VDIVNRFGKPHQTNILLLGLCNRVRRSVLLA